MSKNNCTPKILPDIYNILQCLFSETISICIFFCLYIFQTFNPLWIYHDIKKLSLKNWIFVFVNQTPRLEEKMHWLVYIQKKNKLQFLWKRAWLAIKYAPPNRIHIFLNSFTRPKMNWNDKRSRAENLLVIRLKQNRTFTVYESLQI